MLQRATIPTNFVHCCSTFKSGHVRFIRTNVDDSKLSRGLMADVHGTIHGKKAWRNKPLFRREGDKRFRTGLEAAEMLFEEAARRDPYQVEFLQSVENLLFSVSPVFDRYPKYAWVMKQLLEPERVLQFRVPWVDDTGSNRVNRGFRVQFSSSLGPYMGGLRFHPNLGHGTVKFLGFDNIFKNALAGNYGGASGGSDFNPKGKSEAEIMRFCQSYMTELANYIGAETDIPGAGMGVGQVEFGYMYGQYKRIRQLFGKGHHGIIGGGHLWYPEATGCGVAFLADTVLKEKGENLEGKRCIVSGSGNVALHTAQKLIDLGAIVIAMSDSTGCVVEDGGFSKPKINNLVKIKSERNAKIGAYIMASTSARYYPKDENNIWDFGCDLAFPCAIHNEITGDIAEKLVEKGCIGVFEGADMACTNEAIQTIKKHTLAFGPAKLANSGAHALREKNPSALETQAELENCVKDFIQEKHAIALTTALNFNARGDILAGANIAGFIKVANAMLRQGAV